MIEKEQIVFEDILTQSRKAFKRWYQGDPNGYLALMAQEMTYFSPFMNNRIDGKDAVEAAFAPIKGQIFVPDFDIGSPNLLLGTDMAVLTFHLNELDEKGSRVTGWKVTEIYRKVGEKWLLIHAHYSSFVEE